MESNFWIEINGEIPPREAWPHSIEWANPESTATDLTGRPVGGQGRMKATLAWDLMPVEMFQWWLGFIPSGEASIDLTNLILPCPLSDMHIVRQNKTYLHHAYFASGILGKINQNGASTTWREGKQYLHGRMEITISELEIVFF